MVPWWTLLIVGVIGISAGSTITWLYLAIAFNQAVRDHMKERRTEFDTQRSQWGRKPRTEGRQ